MRCFSVIFFFIYATAISQTNFNLNEVEYRFDVNIFNFTEGISYKSKLFFNDSTSLFVYNSKDLEDEIGFFKKVGDRSGKVNGRSINKLLIGGDDVFGKNYKIATKNIDVNDIEEIDILYNYNENSVLSTLKKHKTLVFTRVLCFLNVPLHKC